MDNVIYVKLIDEGTLVYRPVQALKIENDLFKIIQEQFEDEIWEFKYNDIVRCSEINLSDGPCIVALERIL